MACEITGDTRDISAAHLLMAEQNGIGFDPTVECAKAWRYLAPTLTRAYRTPHGRIRTAIRLTSPSTEVRVVRTGQAIGTASVVDLEGEGDVRHMSDFAIADDALLWK